MTNVKPSGPMSVSSEKSSDSALLRRKSRLELKASTSKTIPGHDESGTLINQFRNNLVKSDSSDEENDRQSSRHSGSSLLMRRRAEKIKQSMENEDSDDESSKPKYTKRREQLKQMAEKLLSDVESVKESIRSSSVDAENRKSSSRSSRSHGNAQLTALQQRRLARMSQSSCCSSQNGCEPINYPQSLSSFISPNSKSLLDLPEGMRPSPLPSSIQDPDESSKITTPPYLQKRHIEQHEEPEILQELFYDPITTVRSPRSTDGQQQSVLNIRSRKMNNIDVGASDEWVFEESPTRDEVKEPHTHNLSSPATATAINLRTGSCYFTEGATDSDYEFNDQSRLSNDSGDASMLNTGQYNQVSQGNIHGDPSQRKRKTTSFALTDTQYSILPSDSNSHDWSDKVLNSNSQSIQPPSLRLTSQSNNINKNSIFNKNSNRNNMVSCAPSLLPTRSVSSHHTTIPQEEEAQQEQYKSDFYNNKNNISNSKVHFLSKMPHKSSPHGGGPPLSPQPFVEPIRTKANFTPHPGLKMNGQSVAPMQRLSGTSVASTYRNTANLNAAFTGGWGGSAGSNSTGLYYNEPYSNLIMSGSESIRTDVALQQALEQHVRNHNRISSIPRRRSTESSSARPTQNSSVKNRNYSKNVNSPYPNREAQNDGVAKAISATKTAVVSLNDTSRVRSHLKSQQTNLNNNASAKVPNKNYYVDSLRPFSHPRIAYPSVNTDLLGPEGDGGGGISSPRRYVNEYPVPKPLSDKALSMRASTVATFKKPTSSRRLSNNSDFSTEEVSGLNGKIVKRNKFKSSIVSRSSSGDVGRFNSISRESEEMKENIIFNHDDFDQTIHQRDGDICNSLAFLEADFDLQSAYHAVNAGYEPKNVKGTRQIQNDFQCSSASSSTSYYQQKKEISSKSHHSSQKSPPGRPNINNNGNDRFASRTSQAVPPLRSVSFSPAGTFPFINDEIEETHNGHVHNLSAIESSISPPMPSRSIFLNTQEFASSLPVFDTQQHTSNHHQLAVASNSHKSDSSSLPVSFPVSFPHPSPQMETALKESSGAPATARCEADQPNIVAIGDTGSLHDSSSMSSRLSAKQKELQNMTEDENEEIGSEYSAHLRPQRNPKNPRKKHRDLFPITATLDVESPDSESLSSASIISTMAFALQVVAPRNNPMIPYHAARGVDSNESSLSLGSHGSHMNSGSTRDHRKAPLMEFVGDDAEIRDDETHMVSSNNHAELKVLVKTKNKFDKDANRQHQNHLVDDTHSSSSISQIPLSNRQSDNLTLIIDNNISGLSAMNSLQEDCPQEEASHLNSSSNPSSHHDHSSKNLNVKSKEQHNYHQKIQRDIHDFSDEALLMNAPPKSHSLKARKTFINDYSSDEENSTENGNSFKYFENLSNSTSSHPTKHRNSHQENNDEQEQAHVAYLAAQKTVYGKQTYLHKKISSEFVTSPHSRHRIPHAYGGLLAEKVQQFKERPHSFQTLSPTQSSSATTAKDSLFGRPLSARRPNQNSSCGSAVFKAVGRSDKNENESLTLKQKKRKATSSVSRSDTVGDALYQRTTEWRMQSIARRNLQKQQRDIQELSECTFAPRITRLPQSATRGFSPATRVISLNNGNGDSNYFRPSSPTSASLSELVTPRRASAFFDRQVKMQRLSKERSELIKIARDDRELSELESARRKAMDNLKRPVPKDINSSPVSVFASSPIQPYYQSPWALSPGRAAPISHLTEVSNSVFARASPTKTSSSPTEKIWITQNGSIKRNSQLNKLPSAPMTEAVFPSERIGIMRTGLQTNSEGIRIITVNPVVPKQDSSTMLHHHDLETERFTNRSLTSEQQQQMTSLASQARAMAAAKQQMENQQLGMISNFNSSHPLNAIEEKQLSSNDYDLSINDSNLNEVDNMENSLSRPPIQRTSITSGTSHHQSMMISDKVFVPESSRSKQKENVRSPNHRENARSKLRNELASLQEEIDSLLEEHEDVVMRSSISMKQ